MRLLNWWPAPRTPDAQEKSVLIGRTSGSALRIGVWDGTGRLAEERWLSGHIDVVVLPCPASKHHCQVPAVRRDSSLNPPQPGGTESRRTTTSARGNPIHSGYALKESSL